MKAAGNRIFLYSGLVLLVIALLGRATGVLSGYWMPVLCSAVVLKIIFLFNVFRSGTFKMGLWFKFILTGIIMIIISLLFKYIFPYALLRNIFFYGAIIFKLSGLILLFTGKIQSSENESA